MLTHLSEFTHPRQVIRGVKVPCTWDYSTRKNLGEGLSFSVQLRALLEQDALPQSIRLRRDGLIILSAPDSMVELVVPPDVVQKMESEPWQSLASSESHLEFLDGADKEYYGVPLQDQRSLFSAPLTVQWDLTSRCNLYCKHCYADSTAEKGEELTSAQVFRVIEEAGHIGILAFHLLGGEPFVRDDLVEVVQHAYHLGIACHISSNGTLIQSNHAKSLRGLHNLTVDVSLDSTRPAHHDWLRGQNGAYHKAVEGMRRLQKCDIRVGTTCTIYPNTLDEMESVAQQAIDLGAYRLQFLFVSPVGRAQRYRDKLLLDENKRQTFATRFKYLVEKYGDTILIDSPVVPFEPKQSSSIGANDAGLWLTGCLAGIDKMAIRSDGSVTACPQLERKYGNIQTSTIQDIWISLHSERLNRLGRGCDICGFDGYCGGGCPAPNSYEYEVAPCSGRRQANTVNQLVTGSAKAAWCPSDCRFPCPCPIHCSLPCDCPTWCNLPCNFPCDCPTWCRVPCSCPTFCSLPCDCPTWCSAPCPCPTHCPHPR